MSKEKSIIIFTVAIDVIGLGIIIPILPVYVESFGLSAFSVSLLFSIYSLFSFLSAPFLGALSDKIGRRPILIGSILSTSLGWFIFALGRSLPLLLLGRIIDGLAAGNISTAQSAISDISKDQKERAGNLGIIGMIFGIGFVIGPFIGGLLSKVSHSFPFIFVGILALLNVVLAYFFLPETNKNISKDKAITWNPLKPLSKAIQNTQLRTLFIVWFIFNSIAVGTNTIFALFLEKVHHLDAFTTGLFFTGIGIVLATNQGFLLKSFWLKKFKERHLIKLMLIIFGFGFLLLPLPQMPFFVIGTFLCAVGQSVLGVALTSEIVSEASETERGGSVGVLSAIGALAHIIAPIFSGLAFQVNHNYPYIMATALTIVNLIIFSKAKLKDFQTEEADILAREVIH